MSNGGEEIGRSPGWTSVPLGVSYFPAELARLPKLCVLLLRFHFRLWMAISFGIY